MIGRAKQFLKMAASDLQSAAFELGDTVANSSGPLQHDKGLETLAMLIENIATMTFNIRNRI